VPSPCTVLIAAATVLPVLTPRASADGHELLTFSDVDALRALDAITGRRPSVVTLDRGFATTTRGAALIKRIRADPSLATIDVRVVDPTHAGAFDDDAAVIDDVSLGNGVSAGSRAATDPTSVLQNEGLDPIGTRRAARVSIHGAPEVQIDGNPAALVDLSVIGAQVLSPTALKPNQRVRVAFSDATGSVRMNGTIVWACFEIPPSAGPRYRAGIEFAGGDSTALREYCRRHSEYS
jgi:hypothetical protein